jgi:hypothetical protein
MVHNAALVRSLGMIRSAGRPVGLCAAIACAWALLGAGCGDAVNLANWPCPCANDRGYYCCTSRNVCLPTGATCPAPGSDGSVGDAGQDTADGPASMSPGLGPPAPDAADDTVSPPASAVDGGDDSAPDGPSVPPGQVVSGYFHSCYLAASGKVWCWGGNDRGQLGDGTLTARNRPTLVPGLSDVRKIVVGVAFTCALHESGTVDCWGQNRYRQLGLPDKEDRLRPTRVPDLDGVTDLAAGYDHACALRGGSASNIVCWGRNLRGELTSGDPDANGHVVVAGVEGAGAIAVGAGTNFSCALLRDQRVNCWGEGSYGSLGDRTADAWSPPGLVDGVSGVQALSLRGRLACALLANATVSCWPGDSFVPSGSTPDPRSRPKVVEGLDQVARIFRGYGGLCVVKNDHTAHCRGGPLGDGTKENRTVGGHDRGDGGRRLFVRGRRRLQGLLLGRQHRRRAGRRHHRGPRRSGAGQRAARRGRQRGARARLRQPGRWRGQVLGAGAGQHEAVDPTRVGGRHSPRGQRRGGHRRG